MKGERDEEARRKVLEVLAAGGSVTAAAKAAGIARQTPYQWADRKDEEMRLALAAAKRRGRGGGPAAGRAPAARPPHERPRKPNADEALALETLRAVARGDRDGEDTSPSAHVQAAKGLLDYHRKLRQDLTPTTSAKPSAPPAVPEDDEDLGALITRISG